MMKEVFENLKLALFPKRCEMCGEVICFDEDICTECSNAEYIEAPVCFRCGCAKKDCVCHKFQREVEYKAVIAPFYYENSISKGILNFKMNGIPKLAGAQGRAVAEAIKKHYEDVDFDFVTFVPMLSHDVNVRGYNQAELLAKVISAECDIPLREVLYKKRKTKMQKRQSARDRFINMYDAFAVAEDEDIADAKILLIDDVKTTGSTLTSVSLTLKAYGAKEVYCAVVAIVK